MTLAVKNMPKIIWIQTEWPAKKEGHDPENRWMPASAALRYEDQGLCEIIRDEDGEPIKEYR